MLVDGQWKEKWQPVQAKDEKGGFVRQTSSCRHWLGEEAFPVEPDRYHLYVAYICPWACRTLMVRKLKKLEEFITVSVVNPKMTDFGWAFGGYPGADQDPLYQKQYLHEIYTHYDSHYTGRATVPVLWDKKQNTMVNNESADIIRMFNSAFNELKSVELDLYPADLQAEIEEHNKIIYEKVNNGVYRCGFATTQEAYNEAYKELFENLDKIEKQLENKRFYFGDRLTETDVRLFVTLIRFDVAYYGLFKCNARLIHQYKNMATYLKNLYKISEIRETVNIDHIKAGYYSLLDLNPTRIVPNGPLLDFLS